MRLTLPVLLCLAAWIALGAPKGSTFDFYLLSLSYAPDFCDQPGGNKPAAECAVGKKLSFVVHGLWPQSEAGRGPEDCGGSPVAANLIRPMLAYMPTAGLIQHEWQTHGTCSGQTAKDYLAQIRRARDAVKIPAPFASPTAALSIPTSELEAKFAAANPAYPKTAFRASCYNNGELQEIRICLNKDLSPRACPATVSGCRVNTVKLMPVR